MNRTHKNKTIEIFKITKKKNTNSQTWISSQTIAVMPKGLTAYAYAIISYEKITKCHNKATIV